MARQPTQVTTLRHKEAKRRNIPTAELEPVMRDEDKSPLRVAYERRNRDLDPQLVWRGKDQQDWSDLIVQAPPLYIQEKVHPKVLIDDLLRQSKAAWPSARACAGRCSASIWTRPTGSSSTRISSGPPRRAT